MLTPRRVDCLRSALPCVYWGWNLNHHPERWASHVGRKHLTGSVAVRSRPERPASVLEWLRPANEAPLESPIQFPVYYGTNRKLVDGKTREHKFANIRGEGLSVGSCLVTVPKTHRFGGVGRTFLKWFARGEGSHLKVHDTTVNSEAEFVDRVRSTIPQLDDQTSESSLCAWLQRLV